MKKICTFMLALMLILGTVCSSAYAATSGWQQSTSGAWYYYNTDGTAQTGWKKVSSKWYYFSSDGIMQTGWQTIGGTTYYFNASGAMTTGWQKIGSTWYYMNSSGAMTTGWQKISGTWYYLKSNGAMACNETLTIDGTVYTFNASGIYSTTHTHSWDSGTVTTAATCTSNGVKTYTCTGCGKTKTESIPATGHSYTSSVTKNATCASNGVKTYTCSKCGNSYTETISATGNHSWNSGTVTTEATCGSTGTKTYTCTVCGTTKTESIPATGNHSWVENYATRTVEVPGETVKVRYCSCDAGPFFTYDEWLLHSISTYHTHNTYVWRNYTYPGTTTTETYATGRTCTVCGYTENY